MHWSLTIEAVFPFQRWEICMVESHCWSNGIGEWKRRRNYENGRMSLEWEIHMLLPLCERSESEGKWVNMNILSDNPNALVPKKYCPDYKTD